MQEKENGPDSTRAKEDTHRVNKKRSSRKGLEDGNSDTVEVRPIPLCPHLSLPGGEGWRHLSRGVRWVGDGGFVLRSIRPRKGLDVGFLGVTDVMVHSVSEHKGVHTTRM